MSVAYVPTSYRVSLVVNTRGTPGCRMVHTGTAVIVLTQINEGEGAGS